MLNRSYNMLNQNRFVQILVPIFLFFHIVYSLDRYKEEFGTVIFVNVLFRHGDRTPIKLYPNDPYKNDSYWPIGYGQLTNLGKEREYELGRWLRARYDHLLGDKYNKDEIFVESTDVDRTLMSAESSLAGLYPPVGDQRWNPDINWQPIPVHTLPELLDKVLAAKASCPRYELELAAVKKSPPIKELDKKYKDIFKYVSEHAGEKIKDLENLEYIYDTLHIEFLNNLTLPNWTKTIYPQPMEEASTYSFMIPTWNRQLKRLKTGPLVQEMVKHMREKEKNQLSPNRSLWIYSAHDSTIANLLNTLGVFERHNPPYTATVLMELRLKGDSHLVTLFYRNSSTQEPYLLTIPGCVPACPLEMFVELTKDVIPDDWTVECHAHRLFDFTPDVPYSSLIIFVMVTSSLIIFLLLSLMSLQWQQRRKPNQWYHKLKTDSI